MPAEDCSTGLSLLIAGHRVRSRCRTLDVPNDNLPRATAVYLPSGHPAAALARPQSARTLQLSRRLRAAATRKEIVGKDGNGRRNVA